MCEMDDLGGFAQSGMTRRRFGALTLGAGVGSMISLGLPRVALAVDTKGRDLDIKTPAGTCDAYFVHPEQGKHPAVLIWPDIFGLREAFKGMATRLAQSGYTVLVVNPFYRARRAPTSAPGADLKDPAVREALMEMRKALTPEAAAVDAKALVGFLDKQAATDTKRKVGTMGYCMGGPLVMRTAAAWPRTSPTARTC